MPRGGCGRGKTYYKLPVVCCNCRWQGYIEYPFGVAIQRTRDGVLAIAGSDGKPVACPNCGVGRMWT